METKELTFEEIDKHITSADLTQYQPGGAKSFTSATISANPGQVLQKVCSIYKVVRPILDVVSKLPLIPSAWKTAIKTFITLMDTLCP